jgi:hypothetical protein
VVVIAANLAGGGMSDVALPSLAHARFGAAGYGAPPALLGRVMSALMLCAFCTFPLSVAISGVLVRHIGPSLFFPVAAGLLAVAIVWGLTQREFREFGARTEEEADGAGTPATEREERAVG